ncbi:MAG: helix-turn-helix domain-containing protein, partial [Bacteriovoracaceae bacterium]|nr:helix-turn-helix domain-containing protein [Bacteriovoracaceae bacterium]
MENTTIGKLLKEVRKEKNISLDDVANKTKININILKALENEDVDSLPNKTYVKGFVKNYAKTVGLDSNVAIEAFENLYRGSQPEEEEATPEEAAAPAQNREYEAGEIQDRIQGIVGQVVNKKLLAGVAVALVLFFIGKGVFNFFSNINSEKSSLNEAQKAKLEELEKVSASDIKPSEASLFELEKTKKLAAQANAEEEPKVEEEPAQETETAEVEVEGDDDQESEEDKKEQAKKVELPQGKLPYKNFYPAPRNLFSVSSDADILDNDEIFPKRFKAAMNKDKHNLFINSVEGDTWLSYQIDGEDIKRFVLKKGKTLFLQADDVILLFMGNLNVAKIFYNNQLVNAETKTGVKSLIFPEK